MEIGNKKIKDISRLTDELISLNKRLIRENEQLMSERDRLIRERTEHIKLIEVYKREEKVRDIYTSFVVSEGDKHKAKRQLEKILREIDVCIDVLSSKL